MIAPFKLIIVYSSWIFFLIANESYLISDFLKLDIQNTKPGDVGGSCILFCFFQIKGISELFELFVDLF